MRGKTQPPSEGKPAREWRAREGEPPQRGANRSGRARGKPQRAPAFPLCPLRGGGLSFPMGFIALVSAQSSAQPFRSGKNRKQKKREKNSPSALRLFGLFTKVHFSLLA